MTMAPFARLLLMLLSAGISADSGTGESPSADAQQAAQQAAQHAQQRTAQQRTAQQRTAQQRTAQQRSALILAGGVSRGYDDSPLQMYHSNSLYNERLGAFANVGVCARSVRQNLVDVNSPTTINSTTPTTFDYFQHSWNPALAAEFGRSYNFSAAHYENNRPYG